MTTAVRSGASIPHLAGTTGHHPRGAGLSDTADGKLDRVLEVLSVVRVDLARVAERQDAMAARADGVADDIADLAGRHRQDVRAIWAALDEVRARPAGLTGRALLAAAGGIVALAVGVVQILSHVTIR